MALFASVDDIVHALENPGSIVVDVRPMAAYNGWTLRHEARGGHIAGAVPFPVAWFSASAGDERIHLLKNKGITPDKSLILYGYDSDDAATAASYLAELGYGSVRILEDGLPAWAADPVNPMERLPRYRRLVHPEWLARLLRGNNGYGHEGDPFILAHTSFDNRDDYQRGHIAGAISLDTLFLEEPEHWNRRNPDELERALLSNGITCDTTVVLYGRTGNPSMQDPHPGRYAGQIAAMRAALLLMYAGVQDVRVLDGGLNAWLSAGYEETFDATVPEPTPEFGCPVPAHPEYIIDIEEAKEYLADPMSELVCMRSWPEFIGEKSGYHYIGPRGRIPGAVFGNCGSDAYHMQNYRNLDNTMLCYREIASKWRQVGIVPDKRIAFYCGTGWRASEAFFYAFLMGWDRVAVYDGGWYEWSIDEGNPVETGIPDGIFINTRRY
jgi:3-mercaptopyruvate sulfurtransferase SseA